MNRHKRYTQEDKILAKKLFIQGLKPEQIEERTGIGARTIHRWKSIEEWDKDFEQLQMGNIGISINLRNAALSVINKLRKSEDKDITSAADTLAKLAKIMERFDPHRVIYSDLLHLFNCLIEFAEMKSDKIFFDKLSVYLPEISQYILDKYGVE